MKQNQRAVLATQSILNLPSCTEAFENEDLAYAKAAPILLFYNKKFSVRLPELPPKNPTRILLSHFDTPISQLQKIFPQIRCKLKKA